MALRLNDSQNNLSDAIAKRKYAGVGETLADAFARIYSMKNSDPDIKRIKAVEKAMNNGIIGREQKAVDNGKKLTKAEVMRLYTSVKEVEQERILSDMVKNMPSNYMLVTTEEQLFDMVSELMLENKIVFDVETTGTDVWSDKIVGHVLSATKADKHYYVPTRHSTLVKQLNHDFVTEKLKKVYERKDVLYIAHNSKFDIHMLDRDGICLKGRLWDTMEAMRLLNENEPTYALKKLATKFLKIESHTYGDLFGQKSFGEVDDLQVALSYAAKDGDITFKLYEFQKKHLSQYPEMLQYCEEVEMPLIKVIVDMEKTGFIIDKDHAEKYGEQLTEDIARLKNEILDELYPTFIKIRDDASKELNLNSSQQLKAVLSAHVGKELPNTDAKKTLKPLAKTWVVVEKLLLYKEYVKLYSTYVKTLPTLVSEYDGKLHANFNQNGAKTGRFSSGNGSVNLQNQPYEARKLFIAPKGKVIVGADFSAQEIRCVAYLSGEPVLINAFEKQRDPYAMMASNFYGKPYEEVYKNSDGSDTAERKEMKVVWLATLYGMSPMSLAEMLGVKKNEAIKLQDDLFDSMPKLKAWIDETKEFAQRHGFVWLDKQQRKRRLPEATMRKYGIPYGKYNDPQYSKERTHNAKVNKAMRQAPNACVQGASAIQTKVTMLKLHELCNRYDGWRLWCTVHDEVLVEVPDSITKDQTRELENVMINSYRWGDSVDNKTDLEFMKRWGEGLTPQDWFSRKRRRLVR
ncbi:DNA polymerase [Staphylococcus felis]|uniref:DNA polymerase n=1 Tax=Staphylococcus felis TaxID=46127 RepID=UPI000E234B82|nr:DNA polymerase [Staphylococcus felis]REI09500.1 DNA polymerase I [Staphylococcus felis]REI33624.1 DNA polymerase I [Staphylococcus felis]